MQKDYFTEKQKPEVQMSSTISIFLSPAVTTRSFHHIFALKCSSKIVSKKYIYLTYASKRREGWELTFIIWNTLKCIMHHLLHRFPFCKAPKIISENSLLITQNEA